jgi:hypothetical protein
MWTWVMLAMSLIVSVAAMLMCVLGPLDSAANRWIAGVTVVGIFAALFYQLPSEIEKDRTQRGQDIRGSISTLAGIEPTALQRATDLQAEDLHGFRQMVADSLAEIADSRQQAERARQTLGLPPAAPAAAPAAA